MYSTYKFILVSNIHLKRGLILKLDFMGLNLKSEVGAHTPCALAYEFLLHNFSLN